MWTLNKVMAKSIPPASYSLEHDFSTLVLLMFWAGYFSVVGSWTPHHRMFSSIPNCLQTHPSVLVAPNHLQLRTALQLLEKALNTYYIPYNHYLKCIDAFSCPNIKNPKVTVFWFPFFSKRLYPIKTNCIYYSS